MKSILKIVAIFTICAATLLSGCTESVEPETVYRDECPDIFYHTTDDNVAEAVTTTLDRVAIDTCPDGLVRYDRDKDGRLNKFELKVVETDFFYKRLAPKEVKAFVELIGYTPSINWNPPPTTDDKVYKESPVSITLENYYSHGNQLEKEGMTFETFMASEWNADNQYEMNKFDCSQMAAYMEWYLENSGYDTVIRVGYYADGTGHAWILTDRDDAELAYECTSCYWVYPDEATARKYEPYGYMVNPSFYTAGTEFESVYELVEHFTPVDRFKREFGWWVD